MLVSGRVGYINKPLFWGIIFWGIYLQFRVYNWLFYHIGDEILTSDVMIIS